MRLMRIALEGEAPTGKAAKEDEFVFYGKIKDFSQLKNATSSEEQVQFEIAIPKTDKNAVEGKQRVRRTNAVGSEDFAYEHTIKTKGSDGIPIETSNPSSEAAFIQYKYLAETGMAKTRYEFPIEGTEYKWEVDVFKTVDGGMHEWCKIDLEFIGGRPDTIPTFPIDLDNLIANQYGNRTEEEETTVRMLYDTVFRISNPIVAKAQ